MDLFREKYTSQTSVGHHREQSVASKCGVVSFYGLGNFKRLMSGRIIPTILGKRRRFPGIGPPCTFWSLMVGLGTVLMPLGLSFSLLMCYSELILKI